MTIAPPRPGDRALMVIASGFGSGYLRPASGTWGSAAAVVLYLPVARLNQPALWWAWALFLIGTFLLGTWASFAGERVTQKKDSGRIVVDEFVGQWIALTFAPTTAATGLWSVWGWSPQHVAVLAAAFFLFRLFDVWKPYPIRQLQSLRGGWGVMVDDVLAGAWACVALHLLLWANGALGLIPL